jgi:hypothetical protein
MRGLAAGAGSRTGIDAAALTQRPVTGTGPGLPWRQSGSRLLNHESPFFDFRYLSI